MIKVKITKNIMRKGDVGFGLSFSQIIIAACALCVGIGIFLMLKDHVSTNILMTLIFLVMGLFIFFGVVRINGMSFGKMLMLSFKGVEKRPYCTKGVCHNVQSVQQKK